VFLMLVRRGEKLGTCFYKRMKHVTYRSI